MINSYSRHSSPKRFLNMSNAFSNPAFEGSPTASLKSTVESKKSVVDEGDCLEMKDISSSRCSLENESGNIGLSGAPANNEIDLTAALCVRNAHKSYQKGNPVLQDFNMTVPVGCIYSLLGSSGCGKTSILSCCVGIRKLDRGTIRIFGHVPGTRESGVPGRKVGFMPQDLSLYSELTIQEAMNFYGRIYGMSRDQLSESTSFLIDFLDLPSASRRVGSLSGGQKRRVSMALTLIHDPELLILDEPTVGVDPLLREGIWSHLVKLVKTGRTTVIITTHYVQEARQSDMIGIMRNGRLLTEKSPTALISEFNVNHLEDIVLTLCRLDRQEKKAVRSAEANKAQKRINVLSILNYFNFMKQKVGIIEPTTLVEEGPVIGLRYESATFPYPQAETKDNKNSDSNKAISNGSIKTAFDSPINGKLILRKESAIPELLQITNDTKNSNGFLKKRKLSTREVIRLNQSTSVRRLTALLIKNFIILMRNIGFLLFIFLVPAVQVILICLTIGSDPKGLLISVVNPEPCDFLSTNWRNISNSCPFSEDTDEQYENGTLSCFYLSILPEESFILESIQSTTEALDRIQFGYTYGYVQFPEDYTKNVICRFNGRSSLYGPKCGSSKEVLDGSNIILELDMSNKQIGQTMKRIFIDTYGKTMDKLKSNCKSKKMIEKINSAASLPYMFKKPLYGKDDTSFREFLAPSILLGLLFFFPLCSSGVSYITEKKTGTLDRALVAGVGATELMGGFLISQVGILLGQAGFAFLILTQVFKIEILGSISLALSLTILVGISGMSAGFLIAMFCTEEVQAVLLAIGTFFPNILLAGMVWPLEGMERGLQYVSYMLPCTIACESMRSIISRGWGLDHRSVWPGFITTIAWIVVYWVLAVIIHRFKSKA